MLCKVGGWNKDSVLGQLLGDLIRPITVNRHGKDALDNLGGFGVNNPLVPCFVPEIAVNDCACEMFSGLALGLEHGFDFAACVTKIVFVHDVAEGSEVVLSTKAVNSVVYGNQANALLPQQFHDLSDLEVIPADPAHVLYIDAVHVPGFNFLQHCHESGTVEPTAAHPVIGEMA